MGSSVHYHGQTMTTPSEILFPMMIKLGGRRCVVVGGGKVAAAKAKSLLACGARVSVVSLHAGRLIRALTGTNNLVYRKKPFSPRDLAGAFLVIAATDSPEINAAVFRSCKARKILCNSVDDPDHCDFFFPAIVRRGPLLIAISTSGFSPALAARLRRELAGQFGAEWADFVRQIGRRRQEILRTAPTAQRMKLLKQIALSYVSRVARQASKTKRARVG